MWPDLAFCGQDCLERTLREHTAQRLPNLTGLLGTVRGLFRQSEAERNLEERLKIRFYEAKMVVRQGSNL
jgi:hypothetical protein